MVVNRVRNTGGKRLNDTVFEEEERYDQDAKAQLRPAKREKDREGNGKV